MIGIFAWRAGVGARDYETLKAANETSIRQRIMASWVLEGVILFGLGSVLALYFTGRLPALLQLPSEFKLPVPVDTDPRRIRFVGYMICCGLLLGSVGPLATALIQRKKTNSAESPQPIRAGAGDFTALYPRNNAEAIWGVLLSLSAGVTEEMMFRVTLPLLLTMTTGNMWLAFALCIPIFGLLHYYQGWNGVAVTSVAALLFTVIYLTTTLKRRTPDNNTMHAKPDLRA